MLSYIQSSIRSLNAQIGARQTRIAELEAQIQRLEEAKSAVHSAYGEAQSFTAWIDSYDVGVPWQGQKREEFETRKKNAKLFAETYTDGILERHNNICDKITQLRNEQAEGWGTISSAYNTINNLSNEMYKYLNK